jgi:hypothetical protein
MTLSNLLYDDICQSYDSQIVWICHVRVCHLNVSLEIFICFFELFLFKYKITLSVMQDSSHLTIILCSSVIKIVIRQKQKDNIQS